MSKKGQIDFSQHSCQLPDQPKILGLERTDPTHAQKYLNHASVPEISSIKTMEQLFQYQFKLRNSLLSSDLFKKVEVSANSAATNEEEALRGDKVKVLVTVEEKSKIGGNVGVEANPNSPGQFETGLKLSLRNCFFGKGESIYFESNKDPLGNLNNSGADPFSSLLPDTYKLTASKPIVTERGVYRQAGEMGGRGNNGSVFISVLAFYMHANFSFHSLRSGPRQSSGSPAWSRPCANLPG